MELLVKLLTRTFTSRCMYLPSEITMMPSPWYKEDPVSDGSFQALVPMNEPDEPPKISQDTSKLAYKANQYVCNTNLIDIVRSFRLP